MQAAVAVTERGERAYIEVGMYMYIDGRVIWSWTKATRINMAPAASLLSNIVPASLHSWDQNTPT